jgi:hypothetical protein
MKTLRILSFVILMSVVAGAVHLKAQQYGSTFCGYGSNHTVAELNDDGYGDIDAECEDACEQCYGAVSTGWGELSYYYNSVYQMWLEDIICQCDVWQYGDSCVNVGHHCANADTYGPECCSSFCGSDNFCQ